MAYEYKFEPERCWYKESCKLLPDNCTEGCRRFMEMDFLMAHSGIPRGAQLPVTLRPETCDVKAFQRLQDIKLNIVDFVQDGGQLYLYSSSSGNGKTSWALKLMLRYFDQIWAGNGFRQRGVFLNVPTFLTRIKAAISRPDPELEALRENLLSVDLVVWDDIAATRLSEYDHTILLTYIDSRVLSRLSNVYTGNFDNGDAVYNALGQRLTSRVWNGSELIGFRSRMDRRNKEADE